jgi:hypothetical protein
VRSTSPDTRDFPGVTPSKCCGPTSPPIRTTLSASIEKPISHPNFGIPTSLASTTEGSTAGITWNNQAILEEHLRLRNTYPDVKLLWSGDWSTYDGPNFWVTVVGLHSDNPYDVLAWCTEQGLDRDNCIAKIVSTTHPIAGSTKLNP